MNLHQPIVFLEAEVNYTWVNYLSGNRELRSITLKRVINESNDTHNFIRIHRKYSVNPAFVAKKHKDSVELTNGVVLPISRRRALELADKLK